MEARFEIASSGALLCADARGLGPAVIMLHAGVADRRMWRATQSFLARSHQTIAYDRRGFGETRAPDEAFSHVDDLDRVIGFFKCRRPILLGCSLGGRIAIDYALRHPDTVAALILVAPANLGAPEPTDHPPEVTEVIAELAAADARGDVDRVNAIEARLWLDGPLATEHRVSGAARLLFLDTNGIALRHAPLTMERRSPPAADQLHKISVPTLVIWGDLDFPAVQRRSAGIAAGIAGAQSLVMTGCAHLPSLEQPERFDSAIGVFIAKSLAA